MERAKLELLVGVFVLVGVACLGYLSNKLNTVRVPTIEFCMSIGAMRYFNSPSGSDIRMGAISPASLPSFLLVETEGTGKICVSAWTEYGAFARSSAASANRIRIDHR